MKGINNKKKFYLLLAGTVLLYLYLFFTVFSDTLKIKSENEILSGKLSGIDNIEKERASLIDLSGKLETRGGIVSNDSVEGRNNLIEFLAGYCKKNKVILKDIPEVIYQRDSAFFIETNVVVLEGGFHDLLKLLYKLEQEEKIARPVSAVFEKVYDRTRKKNVLFLKLYLQNLQINDKAIN